jgi:hypothetical protein
VQKTIPKEQFSTDAVSCFVGRFDYPNVNIGILAPATESENSWEYDAPRFWAASNYQIPDIVSFRSGLINSRIKTDIKSNDRLLLLNQEIAMASKPVDIEITLEKRPIFSLNLDRYMAPSGPIGRLKKAELTSNPSVPGKIEKVYRDTDMKAVEAVTYLYDHEIDENTLSRLLSVATLGIGVNRKLVPTRWSITATDDIIGKHLVKKISDNNEIEHTAYFGSHLGNHYLVLLFPGLWGYELFEMAVAVPEHVMTDAEGYNGRVSYASNTAGGYYSVRLAVLERLNAIHKRGIAVVFRFITGDYTLPLGVWVTREASRNAMKSTPIEFASKELMLEYARKIAKKRFGVSIDDLIRKSLLLKEMKNQTRLHSFL